LIPPETGKDERTESLDAIRSEIAVDLAEKLASIPRNDVVSASDIQLALERADTLARIVELLESVDSNLPELPGIADLQRRVRRRIESLIAGILAGSRKRVNREASFLVTIQSDARDALLALRAHTNGDQPLANHQEVEGLAAFQDLSGFDISTQALINRHVDSSALSEQIDSATYALSRFLDGNLFGSAIGSSLDSETESDLRHVKSAAVLQMGLESLRNALVHLDNWSEE